MGHDWNSESQAGLGSTVEIISSTFELITWDAWEICKWRCQGGSWIYKARAQSEFQLEIATHLKVINVWVVFQATGMHDITWGGRLGVGVSLKELQPLEIR